MAIGLVFQKKKLTHQLCVVAAATAAAGSSSRFSCWITFMGNKRKLRSDAICPLSKLHHPPYVILHVHHLVIHFLMISVHLSSLYRSISLKSYLAP